MYSFASSRLPVGWAMKSAPGALLAAGLLEAGLAGRDEVRRDVAGDRAAERLAQRLLVDRRVERLAHVHVVERRAVGPDRDVAEAAGRRRQLHQVLLVAGRDALEDRRRQLEVAGHHRVALEDLARGDVGIVALLDRDRVEVGGLVVGRRVPVRVAHELDLDARRVAGDLARLVVLDHVRAGRDLVLAVRRSAAGGRTSARTPSAPAPRPASTARRPRWRRVARRARGRSSGRRAS